MIFRKIFLLVVIGMTIHQFTSAQSYDTISYPDFIKKTFEPEFVTSYTFCFDTNLNYLLLAEDNSDKIAYCIKYKAKDVKYIDVDLYYDQFKAFYPNAIIENIFTKFDDYWIKEYSVGASIVIDTLWISNEYVDTTEYQIIDWNTGELDVAIHKYYRLLEK